MVVNFKKIEHKILAGQTFDQILNSYSVNKDEIDEIKDIITNKYNYEIMTLTNDEKNNFFVSTLSKITFQNKKFP